MDTRIIDEELANYGSFVNNQINESESDAELDALQSPDEPLSEAQLLQFGDFVPASTAVEEEACLSDGFNSIEKTADESSLADRVNPELVSDDVPDAAPEFTPETAPLATPAAAGIQSASERKEVAGKEETRKKEAAAKVKRPIGVKLILIISLLVLFSMGVITVLVSYFISKETRINAEENNLTINSRTASDCQSRLNSVISSAGILYDVLISDSEEESLERVVNSFFERNKFIAAISFKDLDSISYNRQFFASNEIDTSLFDAYVMQETEAVAVSRQGGVKLLNASPFFGEQTIAIFTPVYSGTQSDSAVILFACDELSESFANSSINSSTLVNDEGIVLIAPDIQQILTRGLYLRQIILYIFRKRFP